MSGESGKYIIKLLKAQLVRKVRFSVKKHPYCVIIVGKEKFYSQVCKTKERRPKWYEWNEEFEVILKSETAIIKFEVWDSDSVNISLIDFVGRGDLAQINKNGYDGAIGLYSYGLHREGTLIVNVRYVPEKKIQIPRPTQFRIKHSLKSNNPPENSQQQVYCPPQIPIESQRASLPQIKKYPQKYKIHPPQQNGHTSELSDFYSKPSQPQKLSNRLPILKRNQLPNQIDSIPQKQRYFPQQKTNLLQYERNHPDQKKRIGHPKQLTSLPQMRKYPQKYNIHLPQQPSDTSSEHSDFSSCQPNQPQQISYPCQQQICSCQQQSYSNSQLIPTSQQQRFYNQEQIHPLQQQSYPNLQTSCTFQKWYPNQYQYQNSQQQLHPNQYQNQNSQQQWHPNQYQNQNSQQQWHPNQCQNQNSQQQWHPNQYQNQNSQQQWHPNQYQNQNSQQQWHPNQYQNQNSQQQWHPNQYHQNSQLQRYSNQYQTQNSEYGRNPNQQQNHFFQQQQRLNYHSQQYKQSFHYEERHYIENEPKNQRIKYQIIMETDN